MKYSIFISLTLSLLLFAGCGGNVGLSGKVVFSDDQSPVPMGTVGLISEAGTFSARGDIQRNGTFVVGSIRANDGLPPGKYRVSVFSQKHVGDTIPDEEGESGEPIFELLVHPKYGNPDTSGITIEITSTTRNFVIEVERFVP
jgi:hypothetical protein